MVVGCPLHFSAVWLLGCLVIRLILGCCFIVLYPLVVAPDLLFQLRAFPPKNDPDNPANRLCHLLKRP